MKFACVVYYLCAKTCRKFQRYIWTGLSARHQRSDVMCFIMYDCFLLVFLKIKQWWLDGGHKFILVLSTAPHHFLTKLLDSIVHIKFCLISFHLHILFTYYVAVHYVWIQLCWELITCFDVYVDVCHVAFLYIWLFFVCFCLFVCADPLCFLSSFMSLP